MRDRHIFESTINSCFTHHFSKKGLFLWIDDICALLWGLWEERNNRVFRGVEQSRDGVLSLVRFHISLWASICKDFCNYPLGINYYLAWLKHFSLVMAPFGVDFFFPQWKLGVYNNFSKKTLVLILVALVLGNLWTMNDCDIYYLFRKKNKKLNHVLIYDWQSHLNV